MTIRTLTLSPALDYSLTVKDKLTIGAINRTTKESFAPGGKGINVSIILKRLGYTSIALGFLSGFTGEYVEKLLAKEGLQTDFIHIDGITRINVKIDGKVETAINGSGPNATDDDLEKLFKKIEQSESGDILVMSGQIPPTLPSNTYEKKAAGMPAAFRICFDFICLNRSPLHPTPVAFQIQAARMRRRQADIYP